VNRRRIPGRGADLQQIDEGLHAIGAVNSGEGGGCEWKKYTGGGLADLEEVDEGLHAVGAVNKRRGGSV